MAGRKPIKIDLTLVEKYAAMGMNNAQIAESLGICRDTLYRRKNTFFRFFRRIIERPCKRSADRLHQTHGTNQLWQLSGDQILP